MGQALERERCIQHDNLGVRVAYDQWRRAQYKLEQAKAQMLCANLRFVVYLAKQYRDQGHPLPDLIQEGNIGLMRAIQTASARVSRLPRRFLGKARSRSHPY